MAKDDDVSFSQYSSLQEDKAIEAAVCANNLDSVTEGLNEVCQEAYNAGYEGEAFDDSFKTFSNRYESEIAEDQLSDVVEVLKSAGLKAWVSGKEDAEVDEVEEGEVPGTDDPDDSVGDDERDE